MPNDGRPKVAPFALAIVALLYAEHLLFGANRGDLSLLFAVIHLLALAGLIAFTRGREPQTPAMWLPAIPLGVVFAIGLVSTLPLGPPLAHPLWAYAPGTRGTISLDPAATRLELVKLAGLAALFVLGAGFGARRETAERLAAYVGYAGILYCAWSFFAWITTPTSIFGTPRPYGVDRLGGSFLSSNTAATLFAALSVMALLALMRPFTRTRRAGESRRLDELTALWPEALLLVLALSCLLMTVSRGGLIAFVAASLVSIGCLAWIKSSQRSLTGGFVAVVSLLLFATAVVFLVSGERTAARLIQTDPLNNDRLEVFAAFWPTIKASPWLGYGLGSFSSINFLSITGQNALALGVIGAAHNVYLQWLLQEGAPGALAMFGCVGVVLAVTVRGAARRATQQTLVISCLAVAVVFAVHGLVDYALEVPSMTAFFALILGLGYGIAERPAGGKSHR
jgi:O-antigen ligase